MKRGVPIRPELPGDRAAVHRVNALAFGRENEAALVDAPRGTSGRIVSLVAVRAALPARDRRGRLNGTDHRTAAAGEEAMGSFETFVDSVNHGRVEELREQLARDPGMVHRKKDGATPLHLAAIHNQREVADVLLDHGADLEATDEEFGMTPIGWANERGHTGMVRHLFGRGAKLGLARAAACGLEERVREILDAGTEEVNAAADGFGAPVHFASLWGHPGIVALLLERGADPDSRTKNGHTALAVALRQVESNGRDTPIAVEPRRSEIVAGCAKVVELLRSRGALP